MYSNVTTKLRMLLPVEVRVMFEIARLLSGMLFRVVFAVGADVLLKAVRLKKKSENFEKSI